MPKAVGGHQISAIFGTALLAWFVTTFFIAPFVGFGGYSFNILTVLTGLFSFQLTSLVFIAIWAAAYFGYLGIAFNKSRPIKSR